MSKTKEIATVTASCGATTITVTLYGVISPERYQRECISAQHRADQLGHVKVSARRDRPSVQWSIDVADGAIF